MSSSKLTDVEKELAERMQVELVGRKVDWDAILRTCSRGLKAMIVERTPKHDVSCSRMSYLITRKKRVAFRVYREYLAKGGRPTSLSATGTPDSPRENNSQTRKAPETKPPPAKREKPPDKPATQTHHKKQKSTKFNSSHRSPDEDALRPDHIELAWLYAEVKASNPSKKTGATFWDTIQDNASPLLQAAIVEQRKKDYFKKVAFKCMVTNKAHMIAFMRYRSHAISLVGQGLTYQDYLDAHPGQKPAAVQSGSGEVVSRKKRPLAPVEVSQTQRSAIDITGNERSRRKAVNEEPAEELDALEGDDEEFVDDGPVSKSLPPSLPPPRKKRRTLPYVPQKGEQQIGELIFPNYMSPQDLLVRNELQRQTKRLYSMLNRLEAHIEFFDHQERIIIQHDRTKNNVTIAILSAIQRLYSEFESFRSKEEDALRETVVAYRKTVAKHGHAQMVFERGWNKYYDDQGKRFGAFLNRLGSVFGAF